MKKYSTLTLHGISTDKIQEEVEQTLLLVIILNK